MQTGEQGACTDMQADTWTDRRIDGCQSGADRGTDRQKDGEVGLCRSIQEGKGSWCIEHVTKCIYSESEGARTGTGGPTMIGCFVLLAYYVMNIVFKNIKALL